MKIGIDIRALKGTRTGVGRFILKYLEALGSRNESDEYLLFYNAMRGEMPDGFEGKRNFRLVRSRIPSKVLNLLWAYSPIPPVDFLTGKIDVFHSLNYQIPPALNAALVLTIHDLVFLIHPEMAIPSAVSHFRRRMEYYAGRADMIVADSLATASDIREYLHVPSEKVEVVYPGTIPIKAVSADDISRMKAKFGLDGSYILFVGSLEPRKNLARLFMAFDRSGLSNDFQLVLAGPQGWYFDKLRAEWNSLECKDRIRRLNYVTDEDLAALYGGAVFLAYPSLFEGFGLPILEAMSAGCPVLTSDTSSIPEVAGAAALLVNPLDIDSIADGLKRLAGDSDLRERLKNAGRLRASTFTWGKMADDMMNVYSRAYDYKNL